jgi:hypothetical protein
VLQHTAKAQLTKKLLKRQPQTLKELAVKIGCKTGELTHAISLLVTEGVAVKHAGRPPKYTKA